MAKTAVKTKKKVKKQIASGMAHVNSTWNNTIVTISDAQGNVVSWSTAGAGYVWSLFSAQKRTWHDIASRTVLVDLRPDK